MPGPQMGIRIAMNLAELRKNLAEGRGSIEALGPSVEKMASTWSKNSASVIQNANNITAAISKVGAGSLTAGDSAKNLKALETALAQLKQIGQPIPPLMQQTADQLRAVQAAAGVGAPVVEGFGARITGLVAAGAAARAALQGVVQIGSDWIASSNAQETATVGLTRALQTQGTFTPQLRAQYQALSDEFEKTTGHADELVMEMQGLFVQIGNVGPKDMKAALTAATNLSAGLGIDLTAATKAVAKAFDGGGAALNKMLPSLKDLVKDGATTEEVLAQLNTRFGGQAQAHMETYAGKMRGIHNTVDNTKESLGDFIKAGLSPMLEGFASLPEPMQKTAVGIGLVAGATTTLAVAIAGVSAAVKLALPLLGLNGGLAGIFAFLPTLGTAALFVGLGGAIYGVGKAIADLYSTWKSGGSIWEFFTARDEDNFVRRWLGISNSIKQVGKDIELLPPTVGPAMQNFSAQLQATKDAVSGLTAEQRTQIKAGGDLNLSTEEILKGMKKLFPTINLSEDAVKLYTDQLKKSEDATKKLSEKKKELTEFIAKENLEWSRLPPTIFRASEQVTAASTRMGEAIIANALLVKKTQDEISEIVHEKTMGRVDFQIHQIERWAYNELLALDKVGGASEAAQKDLEALKKLKIGKVIEDDALEQWKIFANLATDAKKKTEEMNIAAKSAAYDGLAAFFTQLAQIAGDNGIGKFLGSAGALVVGLQSADKWSQQTGKNGANLNASMGSLSVAFDSNASGAQRFAAGVQAAAVITQGAITIWREASIATTRLGAAFNGAMAGASAGAAFGPWGAAAGVAVGVIASLFQDKVKKAVQAANVEIEKIRVNLLATYGPMDELQRKAQLVGLSFVENWGHQGAEGLRRMQEMARQLEERLRLVGEASGKMASGFAAVVPVMTAGYSDVAKRVKDAQDALDKLKQSEETTKEQLAAGQIALTRALTDQHATGERARQGLADLGTQGVATFAAVYMATGSYSQALAAVAPSLSTLRQAYIDLGLDVDNVAVRHLMIQSAVATSNPALIAAIDGQAGALQGAAQMGLLNADTFAAMQRTGTELYLRLQSETSAAALASGDLGDQTRNALLPMQAYLQQAATQAGLLGIPLDANTERLIAQSKELGIWREKGKDANDKLIEGMSAIVAKLDDVLTRLLGVGSSLTNMPDGHATLTVDHIDRYFTQDMGELPGAGGGEPPPSLMMSLTSLASPPRQSYAPLPSSTGGGSRSARTIVVPVYLDGREIARATVPYIPDALQGLGV